jgi:hypothetical protein
VQAIHQHSEAAAMQSDLASMEAIITGARHTLFCLDHGGTALTRIWCLYEIWCVHAIGWRPSDADGVPWLLCPT